MRTFARRWKVSLRRSKFLQDLFVPFMQVDILTSLLKCLKVLQWFRMSVKRVVWKVFFALLKTGRYKSRISILDEIDCNRYFLILINRLSAKIDNKQKFLWSSNLINIFDFGFYSSILFDFHWFVLKISLSSEELRWRRRQTKSKEQMTSGYPKA